MAAKPTQKPSNKATPAKANKEKNSVSGGAECGVSRGVGDAGRSVRPILAAFAARQGAGFPAKCPPHHFAKNVKLSSKKTTQNRQRVNKESKKGKFSL